VKNDYRDFRRCAAACAAGGVRRDVVVVAGLCGESALKEGGDLGHSGAAAQRQFYPGASAVTTQRISDWRRGKRVPQRFESVETMLKVLIGEARKKNTPPAMDGLYDLRRWQRWWSQARTASSADATDQAPQIPSTTCPYQGLAAFEATDSARFFGRTRSVSELVALIQKAQADNPGIVLLTGPSGAGKSSLLSAGLSAAVSSGALDSEDESGWVSARMTPGDDPMAALRRCLDQPDIKERAEGVGVLCSLLTRPRNCTARMSAPSRGRNSLTYCTR
jgi:AAA ATPase domain